MAALGHTWYQTIIPTRTTNASKKSTIGTVTPASGSRTRGKYTFVTSATVGDEARARERDRDAKYVHGRSAEYVKIGYGTPFEGKLAKLPEDEREDDHRQEGLEDRPGDADRRLLVAHRDVAPDEASRAARGSATARGRRGAASAAPGLIDGHSLDPRRRLRRLGGGSRRAFAHLQLGVSHARRC